MATIAENLQKIVDIKQDIKTAIENKGVDMTNTPFSEYSTKIDEITTGGGTFVVPDGMKFQGSTFTTIPDNMDFSEVTDGKGMFEDCKNLTVAKIDCQNMNTLYNGFYNCTGLAKIELLNTENVTNMTQLFRECIKLEEINYFETSACTSMNGMFNNYTNNGKSKLKYIPNFNTSNVTDFSAFTRYSGALEEFPEIDTSKAISIWHMISSCDELKKVPLLDFSSVLNKSSDNYQYFLYYNPKLTDVGGFLNLGKAFTGKTNTSIIIKFNQQLTPESVYNIANTIYDMTTNSNYTGQAILNMDKVVIDRVPEETLSMFTTKGWSISV